MLVIWNGYYPIMVGHVGDAYDPKRSNRQIKEALKAVSHYRLSRLRKNKIPERVRKAK